MSDTNTQLLIDIKEKITEVATILKDIQNGLSTDRVWLWRILGITIVGAFALVGIKLVIPS